MTRTIKGHKSFLPFLGVFAVAAASDIIKETERRLVCRIPACGAARMWRGGAGDVTGEAAGDTLLFLFTGEGAHSDLTDMASLRASPSWGQVEVTLRALDVCSDLETLLRAQLGVHTAPLSPVISTIVNILNSDRWCAEGHTPTHVLGHSIGEVAQEM